MSDSVGPQRRQPTRLPVPGILQARTLEWVAISFSNAWKWKVKVKSLSRVRLLATPWTAAYQAPPSLGFSKQEYRSTGVGCHCLLWYIYACIYICIHCFSYYFPLWFITGYWIWFPVLHSRTLLFIRPMYNSSHLLILNSQSIAPTSPPPWQPQVCSVCLMSHLNSTYKWYHMVFVLFLTYFT